MTVEARQQLRETRMRPQRIEIAVVLEPVAAAAAVLARAFEQIDRALDVSGQAVVARGVVQRRVIVGTKPQRLFDVRRPASRSPTRASMPARK